MEARILHQAYRVVEEVVRTFTDDKQQCAARTKAIMLRLGVAGLLTDAAVKSDIVISTAERPAAE
jgi:hypothetical protein